MTAEKTINETSKPFSISKRFNRIAYVLLICLSVFFFFFTDDFMTGVSNLGLALAFDPFNQQTTWKERPIYQKVWLLIHVSLVLVLFCRGFFLPDL